MDNLVVSMLFIYGSTTIASLTSNRLYYIPKYKKAFEESKRKLKYKELSTGPRIAMNREEESVKTNLLVSRFMSIVPIYQIIHTVNNINKPLEEYIHDFDEDIRIINEEEIVARHGFLEEIKKSKCLPEDIEEKLKDEEYLPSETEYRKVLMLNMNGNQCEK